MTLDQLIQEVYVITGRPTLVAETNLAVRGATISLHQVDNWWRDLVEVQMPFSLPSQFQDINIDELFPRFRALSYIRTPAGRFLDILTPEEILDEYSRERTNCCYAAGSTLQIKSQEVLSQVIIGMYMSPDVTLTGFDSWIARAHPFAIIYGAAERVFKMIGKSEEFAAYREFYAQELQNIRISGIKVKGE